MYHDFGYFYPYPKQLSAVEQVHTPLSLQHFLSGLQNQGLLARLGALFKYFWLLPLKKQLCKHIQLHLVPSPFMQEIVSKSYGLSPDRVCAFEHCIQE